MEDEYIIDGVDYRPKYYIIQVEYPFCFCDDGYGDCIGSCPHMSWCDYCHHYYINNRERD